MKIIIYFIIFVVFFVLYVRYLEKNSVFFPEKRLLSLPSDIGLAFEDIYFQTDDQLKINGWLVKAPSPRGTVIFFHGNAGNIGDRLGKIELLHQLRLSVFIIDYRGYGQSEGVPTEAGIYKDAVAAYDYLAKRDDIDANSILLYGASLGGAVAIDLAVHRPVKALIIDSSFSHAADMAKRIFPFVPSFMIEIKLDSLSKIIELKMPKLFIHSSEDETVPIALGKKLYEASPPPKEFVTITGSHNDSHIIDEDTFIRAIEKFLGQI